MEIINKIKYLNNKAKEFFKDRCIHSIFEEQVEKTPDAIALEFEGAKLSFKELNSKANQFANYLRKYGVGPEVIVAVCAERSFKMIVSLLGILKAGGAYVPIDPNYPRERISFLINDSKAPVLITEENFLEKLSYIDSKLICIDRDWKEIEKESIDDLTKLTLPENLSYIIYTSGSTGSPKGVLGIHRAAINRFHWMWQNFPFEYSEVCCQKTSLSFVDSIWEIFGPLLSGIKLVIIKDEVLKDPYLFIKTLSEKEVTRIVLVPALLRVIINTYKESKNDLSKLKYWFSSGEALTEDLYKSFYEVFPLSKLINLYGSSEVAADVTVFDTSEKNDLNFIPLGKPISNCEIYILDPDLNLVNEGEAGEIHAAGECLARGYLYKPDLTCEKFIPNPFDKETGSRLYKTGDIARYLEDGNIEYLGRVDHQVKIRGFRIELGEIENTILKIENVNEAIIITKEDESASKYLIAYMVSDKNQTIDINTVKKYLKEKLPAYMIPSAFVVLKQMPLTPNGKIDRNVLSVLTSADDEGDTEIILPETSTEEAILEIWKEVLGKKAISVKDNFFEIGGHSLLATQIISRIRNNFDVEFSLKMMFEKPNIKETAEWVEQTIFDEINGMSDEEANKLISRIN